jgi:hypothetical protein
MDKVMGPQEALEPNVAIGQRSKSGHMVHTSSQTIEAWYYHEDVLLMRKSCLDCINCIVSKGSDIVKDKSLDLDLDLDLDADAINEDLAKVDLAPQTGIRCNIGIGR